MSSINPFQINKTPCQSNQSSSSSSSSAMPQSCPPNEQEGKSKMNRPRPICLPELLTRNSRQELVRSDNSNSLEGISRNIKHILKLLQELKDSKQEDSSYTTKRLSSILNFLEDILSPRSPKPQLYEENQKLRRELSASLTARKSLEKMFSGLGREKEMIATELARKVQELIFMEELVNDLRADNNKLSEKVKEWCKVGGSGGGMEVEELKEKNRELSEKLLKALDRYKTGKRMLREAREENERVRVELEGVVETMKRISERRGEVVEGEM
ncbi:hypothetical protein IEQ34_015781 [Dendrobium chrysotoxum]|uniref:Uncharacterized protein n=1 Tax=Dendrobium chrysotoxum TaxID=161865 RepID=A0AAV7GJD7_DENCH|nr:hypothetical protein IEQ34_015781 [Dendrobium chrysotoxum]